MQKLSMPLSSYQSVTYNRSNQLVTCQSFYNLLSDEHPKHKSSDHMNKKYNFFACRFRSSLVLL